MLKFTLLGYCLRRSSFKLRVACVALSPAKWHRQMCLHRPLSGPQFQPPLQDNTFSSGPDNGLCIHRLAGESTTRATRNLNEERRRQ